VIQGGAAGAAIARAGEGVPAGSVCIPRRYSHSPAETADPGDCYHAFRLLEAVVRTNGPDRRFDFLVGDLVGRRAAPGAAGGPGRVTGTARGPTERCR